MKAYQAFILSPDGGEGRVNRNLLLPLLLGEGGRRPGEGVAADGARVFSVDGVVRCIIWVVRSPSSERPTSVPRLAFSNRACSGFFPNLLGEDHGR